MVRSEEPGNITAGRKGRPLILGVGDEESIGASGAAVSRGDDVDQPPGPTKPVTVT
ncbi:MAG: hypothetical protein JXQ75_19580 [Phycisphaerae bacterium]|nr:hypothetical protein [Phycisphaerae bacterium]